MSRTPEPASVLIVERDACVRALMSTVLQRARCRTSSAADADGAAALLARDHFDVVVRDRFLQTDALIAADVVRRTILTTTVTADLSRTDAFAVLLKPFDIVELARVVTLCARPAAYEMPVIDMAAVERFVRRVPGLRRTIGAPVVSQRELLLRAEMRRAITALSVALGEAATIETSTKCAALLETASVAAAELLKPRPHASPRSGH